MDATAYLSKFRGEDAGFVVVFVSIMDTEFKLALFDLFREVFHGK